MADTKLRVVVNPSGGYTFVYTDELAPLVRHGSVTTRASNVEPARRCNRCHRPMSGLTPDGTTAYNAGACECGGLIEAAGWTADMRPVGGPVLYAADGQPFPLRADALAAEREWLSKTWGL